MAGKDPRIPDFEKPPVIETVMGIEFEPSHAWGIPLFGAFWSSIRQDYPRFRVQPPNPPESLPLSPVPNEPGVLQAEFGMFPVVDARCFFIDPSGTRMLQLQSDRFMLNWQAVPKDQQYPHYSNNREFFHREWERYKLFLSEFGLPLPKIRKCEVTYVNHIEPEAGERPANLLLRTLRSGCGLVAGSFLPPPAHLVVEAGYPISSLDGGLLRIAAQPMFRFTDGKQVVEMVVSARGRCRANDDSAIMEALDTCHHWVVNGFADVTTDAMQKVWGRRA